jgi:hypothetical protein
VRIEPTPEPTQRGVDDRPSQEDKDYDEERRITFHNATTGEKWDAHHRVSGHQTGSLCKCDTVPSDDCVAYRVLFCYKDLCEQLDLDPTRMVVDSTTGRDLEVVYPWYSESEGGCGADRDDYREEDSFDHEKDPWGWLEHTNASFEIGLHRNMCKDFYVRGTARLNTNPPDPVPAEEFQNSVPSAEDDTVAEHQKVDYDDYDETTDLTGRKPSREAEKEGDETGGEGDKSDSEEVDADDDDEEDQYEIKYHVEVDAYLRYGVVPLRFKPKNKYKDRKIWTQNVRRRYVLRGTRDSDNEVYQRCVQTYVFWWVLCFVCSFVLVCLYVCVLERVTFVLGCLQ